MQFIRKNTMVRKFVYLVIVALVLPYGASFAQGPSAGDRGRSVTSVVVLPFENASGVDDPLLPKKAAAAVVLQLEATREFIVTSSLDLEREMNSLGITAPVSQLDQIRLGQALRVDKVLTGVVRELSSDRGSGRTRCSLEIRMLDVTVQEHLDGAATTQTTTPKPGAEGDITKGADDALRSAAQAAVTDMLAGRVRRGNVDVITDRKEVNINLGIGDGMMVGAELLVMRPTWSSDLAEVVMRRVGVLRVSEVLTNMSWAKVIDGQTPQTGDKTYRLYKGTQRANKEARSRQVKGVTQMLAGFALLFGIYAIGTGTSTASDSTVTGNLSQAACGVDPTVVLKVRTDATELERTHGWVIYRDANNPFFPTTATRIIDVIEGRRLPNDTYSDDPYLTEYIEDFEFTFTWYGEEGEAEDADVEASWNHWPMTIGSKYYYVVRRIIEPLQTPGYNPPVATNQEDEPVEASLQIDVETGQALSDPSDHFGPVTFFTPAQLSAPARSAPSQYVDNVTFTWQVSTGADIYRVELYPSTDPDGRGSPYWVSSDIRASSGDTVLSTAFSTASSSTALAYDSQYYWRVGCRASGDATQPVNRDLRSTGWLYSEMRSFYTQIEPPGPVSANDTDAVTRPSRVPGFYGRGTSPVRRGH